MICIRPWGQVSEIREKITFSSKLVLIWLSLLNSEREQETFNRISGEMFPPDCGSRDCRIISGKKLLGEKY
jgi:hypothetical protein